MPATKPQLQGVIFDMDGVLVDSETIICQAACEMFKRKELVVKPEDFTEFIGTGEDRYLGGVASKYNFTLDIQAAKKETYDIFLEMIVGNLLPLPGVHDFISKLKQRGLKIALATSADRRKAIGNLTEINLPEATFDAVVTGEDVINKKPAPDIFLLAAKQLNLSPSECLVIEDAITGVSAAKAAGALCLGLTTSFSKDQLCQADYISCDLSDVPQEAISW